MQDLGTLQEMASQYYLVGFIIWLVVVAGMWGVFKKAGETPWFAIIPILDIYILCKVALKDNVILFTILSIIFPIVLIYVYIKLAKAFGKGTGFGILTFFFSFIMIPVLGFSGASYIGAQ